MTLCSVAWLSSTVEDLVRKVEVGLSSSDRLGRGVVCWRIHRKLMPSSLLVCVEQPTSHASLPTIGDVSLSVTVEPLGKEA